jgi:SH3-like domain-containing protein
MKAVLRAAVAGGMIWAMGAGAVLAQDSQRPMPRPSDLAADTAATDEGSGEAGPLVTETPALAAPKPLPEAAAPPAKAATEPPRDPNRGSVTNLPLPRYVSLKGNEGNARRGPGLTHRIDWVFTRAGMPLRITAEHEHWRRVEDAEGAGGWIHYALLSGVRSVLVAAEVADFRSRPDDASSISFRAERNVVGWVQECRPDWCRISVNGERGWVHKSDLWGVDPAEVIE